MENGKTVMVAWASLGLTFENHRTSIGNFSTGRHLGSTAPTVKFTLRAGTEVLDPVLPSAADLQVIQALILHYLWAVSKLGRWLP